jgi:AraC-like DNA-binding protein
MFRPNHTLADPAPANVVTQCQLLRQASRSLGPRGDEFAPAAHLGARSPARQFDPAATLGRLSVSLAYMQQHLHEPMKIATLSAMAGFSESRFHELFKLATGFSPMNWIIRARMQCACEKLAGTDLSVKQIAAQIGYGDPLYFSRLFKSVTGLSPSAYRGQDGAKSPKVIPLAGVPQSSRL